MMAVAAQTMTGAPRPQRVARSRERDPAQERPAALPALTGLRILPALLVVLFHIPHFGGPALLPLVAQGYVGVSIFFVLSGFILAYSWTPHQGARAFYVARLARVYPLYLTGLALAALPYLGTHPAPLVAARTLLLQVLLLQSWLPAPEQAWNGVGWSLSVEALFYAAFPLLAGALVRLGRRRLVLLGALAAGAALVAPALLCALNPDHAPDPAGWESGPWQNLLTHHPLVHLPCFVLGLAAGRLFVLDSARGRTSDRRGHAHASGPLCLVSLVALVLALWAGPLLPYVALHDGLLAPLVALLLYGLACGRGPLVALLAHPAVVALGEASYGLYLLHVPLHDWLVRLAAPPAGARPLAQDGYWLAYVALCLAASLLSLRLLEQPARRALRRRLVPARASASGALHVDHA